jgi:hypothetical protein
VDDSTNDEVLQNVRRSPRKKTKSTTVSFDLYYRGNTDFILLQRQR